MNSWESFIKWPKKNWSLPTQPSTSGPQCWQNAVNAHNYWSGKFCAKNNVCQLCFFLYTLRYTARYKRFFIAPYFRMLIRILCRFLFVCCSKIRNLMASMRLRYGARKRKGRERYLTKELPLFIGSHLQLEYLKPRRNDDVWLNLPQWYFSQRHNAYTLLCNKIATIYFIPIFL
jgi:hypothetical protein